jgi:hypothetical protein
MFFSKHFNFCKKTGRIIGLRNKALPWWIAPAAGAFATLWYLVRVIPKPSRASYPCMKAAVPVSMGFLIYAASLLGSVFAFRKARFFFKKTRYVFAVLFLLVSSLFMFVFISNNPQKVSAAPYVPLDGANKPMGTARGIFPGRVVWSHDPSATSWNGTSGYWFEAKNTDQEKVNAMMAKSVLSLTGKETQPEAWSAIFKYFNNQHGKGAVGYSAGENIGIKINQNTARLSRADTNLINATPQSIVAVIDQLVNQAGVPQKNIFVYDGSRLITSCIYKAVYAVFPAVRFMDQDGGTGIEKVVWSPAVITYAKTTKCGKCIPTIVRDASYIVNLCIMKGHGQAGMTLCAKNHYGSIHGITAGDGGKDHDLINGAVTGPNKYNPLVDLMGHKHLGGKTLLFMIDALYGSNGSDSPPAKWQMAPFNNDWKSSLFISLDEIAIESVGFDFMNTERAGTASLANSDCFLHEAATAENPKSGTVYAPNGDNVRLKSLGVHEHWNNSTDKKYSRNLDPVNGKGIELVYLNNFSVAAVNNPATEHSLLLSGADMNVVYTRLNAVLIKCTPGTRYSVVDASGKTKLTRIAAGSEISIDLGSLSKGYYFVRFNSNNKSYTKKIVVK